MQHVIHAACNIIEYYNIYKTLTPTYVGSMPRGMITYKSYKNYLEQEALRSLASE